MRPANELLRREGLIHARHRPGRDVSSGSRHRHRCRCSVRPAGRPVLALPPVLRIHPRHRHERTRGRCRRRSSAITSPCCLRSAAGWSRRSLRPRSAPSWCCSPGGWPSNQHRCDIELSTWHNEIHLVPRFRSCINGGTFLHFRKQSGTSNSITLVPLFDLKFLNERAACAVGTSKSAALVWRVTMPLQRGEVQGYDFNRMIVEFTIMRARSFCARSAPRRWTILKAGVTWSRRAACRSVHAAARRH